MDHLELDQLVELRDQYSNVYPLSPTAARGWVRAKREYPKTDPEVYIEWDKTHWRYHGERDGWTFAHHFQAVTDEIPDAAFDMHEMLAEAQETAAQTDVSEAYLDTLMAGQEAALGADGFFMITLTPRTEGSSRIYEPEVYGEALDHTTLSLLEAQLISVAAQLMEGAVLSRVERVKRGDGR